MRPPRYIITWPDIHPAVIEQITRRLRANPDDKGALAEAAIVGATVQRIPYTRPKPPPAIVRRARARAR